MHDTSKNERVEYISSRSSEGAFVAALGLDIEHVVEDSLTIAPLGQGFIVRWDGVTFITRDELEHAMEAQTNAQ